MTSNQFSSDSITFASLSSKPNAYVVNNTEISPIQAQIFSKFRDLQLDHYLNRTPSAKQVIALLKNLGADIVNDHIALRTLTLGPSYSGKAIIEPLFLSAGYERQELIEIPALFLNCHWYEPPASTNWPKVFISEQDVKQLPSTASQIASTCIDQVTPAPAVPTLKTSASTAHLENDIQALHNWLTTSPFKLSQTDYQTLQQEASNHPSAKDAIQYLSWTLTNGYQWNHFTVLLNMLGAGDFKTLEELNAYIESQGFTLNTFSGKQIQGSNAKLLKQSSTIADKFDYTFLDGSTANLPASFIEFIERFYLPDGRPMNGFIAGNARGIFTSTNADKSSD